MPGSSDMEWIPTMTDRMCGRVMFIFCIDEFIILWVLYVSYFWKSAHTGEFHETIVNANLKILIVCVKT